MAVFLRGNVWWFEWRNSKERVVKSTGFRKDQKAKAQAVFDAFRLSKGQKPRRTVVEGILEAIYSEKREADAGLPLTSLWSVYQDWMAGKGKVISRKEGVDRHGVVDRLVRWAMNVRSCGTMADVDVSVARAFVAYLRDEGLSNKTQRRSASVLSSAWEAIGQLQPGIHNPWKAACPDNDGTGVVRGAFTPAQEALVLEEAARIGHDWHLASVISRWTGLRYGDVARLDWSQVDLEARTLDITPAKTSRHGVRLRLPLAGPLHEALSAVHDREGFVLPEHALGYGKPLEPTFSSVLRAAGLETGRYTFHSWRHTFRTRLAEAGVSDDLARRLGGWTNLAMAAHYDHAERLAELRQAVSKMEAVGV